MTFLVERSTRKTRAWRALVGAAFGLSLGTWTAAAGCGARSELLLPDWGADAQTDAPVIVPPSEAFCAEKTYDSGPTDLSMYVLLDRSGSMILGERWLSVSAALSAFVNDPKTTGLGFALQYFPLHPTGDNCIEDEYANPAVPMAKLPEGADAVAISLAQIEPEGETPTRPALRGAVQYARAIALANPKERVVVMLVTDGAPNQCDSDAQTVSAVAAEAAAADPKILTYVIGIATGYNEDLALVAAAGGSGKLILVDDGAASAQKLVDAMLGVKLSLENCTYGVPIPAGTAPKATDLSVRMRSGPDDAWTKLPIVFSFADCAGEAFYVDSWTAPGSVTLCPAACEAMHAAKDSEVSVTAGCGEGTDAGPPDADSGKTCSTGVDFNCVDACLESTVLLAPSCIDGEWTCPPGTFSDATCDECPAVPHGCCLEDGSWVDASCVGGAWTCPAGAAFFGEPGCTPPDACTKTLPCAFGSVCNLPDDSCGKSSLLGTCHPVPAPCEPGNAPACGCDGTTYPSACAAADAGIDLWANGPCPKPAGTFACGPYFCGVGGEVCRQTTFLGSSAPDEFACLAVPPGCGVGCDCKLCDVCPPNGPCGLCGPEGPEGGVHLKCNQL